jgi:hypothetical protein
MRWIARTVALFIAAWSLAAVPADELVDEPAWVPSEALVREIDAGIELPAGASPRSEYARYYAPFTRHDLQSLVGTFNGRG